LDGEQEARPQKYEREKKKRKRGDFLMNVRREATAAVADDERTGLF